MSKLSKITVKHYLNTNLKPKIENGLEKFPVYIQVIFNRKIYKFKSENVYFEYLDKTQIIDGLFTGLLNSELKRVERCVNLIAKHDEKLLTSKDIYKLSKPLSRVIEKNFCKLIEYEIKDLPRILINASYSAINEILLFLNAFHELNTKSEKVRNVITCLNIIGYPNNFNYYNMDYCVVDLYLGHNFLIIYNDLESESGDEKRANKLLSDFRQLAEL